MMSDSKMPDESRVMARIIADDVKFNKARCKGHKAKGHGGS